MQSKKIIKENIDIRDYPATEIDSSVTDTTIGDLHANALLFLNFLKAQGLVEFSEQDYQKFAELYTLPELQPHVNQWQEKCAPIFTYENENDKQQKIVQLKAIHEQFNLILKNLRVIDTRKLARLIGDDLVDRGISDYFMLKMFQKLHEQGANFEILLSNHGVEFVEACERFVENGNRFVAPRIANVRHGNSFVALQAAIDAGVVTHEEVLDIYNQVYKKHLKIISYSLDADANEIQVFSHAGIGLNHIKGLARKFGVAYSAKSAVDLAKTIDRINIKFAQKAQAGEIHTLYTNEMMYKGYLGGRDLNSEDEVVAATVWGREYLQLVREAIGFKVTFIHGHDSDDPDQESHVTLNEPLGQFDRYMGTMRLYATNGRHSVPIRNELRNPTVQERVNHPVTPARAAAGFFNGSPIPKQFPATYNEIWNQHNGNSDINRIKALLRDYTKEDSIFGSFWGRIFTGHWNRHHVTMVHDIIKARYSSVEDLIAELKALNPRKDGSLDRRISFIESQLNTQTAQPLILG